MHKQFDALFIGPNKEQSSRLFQAARFDHDYGKIDVLTSLQIAAERLADCSESQSVLECQRFDVIFISDQFPVDDVRQFVEIAKKTRAGQGCAYILLVDVPQRQRPEVGQNLIKGMDGFLSQPFSVDSLQQISEIADKVRRETALKHIEAGVNVVVQAMMEEIDNRAALVAESKKAKPFSKGLEAASEMLRSFSDAEIRSYYQMLIDLFSSARAAPAKDLEAQAECDSLAEQSTISTEITPELSPLLSDLKSTDWKTRADAAQEIGKLGETAQAATTELCQVLNEDNNKFVRLRAALALIMIGTPEALTAVRTYHRLSGISVKDH